MLKSANRPGSLSQTRRPGGWFFLAMVWLIGIAACNDYPFQALSSRVYTEVTESQLQAKSRKVDILFVLDNSGSMSEEQAKLRRNFNAFISTFIDKGVLDFQIGVVTTDMEKSRQSGRLQGKTKIIRGAQLSRQQVIDAFAQNTNVGIEGSGYEKGLDAMKAALSAPLITDSSANKGFLRDGALLAVVIVGDEDDCSHNGKLDERRYLPDVCYVPPTVMMRESDGKPRKDRDNPEETVYGKRDLLVPVQDYVKFFRGLKDSRGFKREVIISGLIGDPKVLVEDPSRPGKFKRFEPAGGCREDQECSLGGKVHYCGFFDNAGKRSCGGCRSTDAEATVPGFRFFELIESLSTKSSADRHWFPICGDDEGFRNALFNVGMAIVERVNYVVLPKPPQIDLVSGKPYLKVSVVLEDGRVIAVEQAPESKKSCHSDRECGGDFVCASTSRCAGDGWVYFPGIVGGGQSRVKLSGKARRDAALNSNIRVSYAAKQ